jgi:ABC-type nitrate/sulfonate/bicarbonate transport system substrate-binding protein
MIGSYMHRIQLSLLRGVCQMPGYVAADRGIFRAHGLTVELDIAPTAWVVPDRLLRGELEFAVMPWTRVVAASAKGQPLVLVCGSGREEAAIVVRRGVAPADVRRVAIPKRGGIKDLTAMGLVESLGWRGVDWVRQPSGDGAILAFVGEGADAASMVEPYATMLRDLGLGDIVRRTGDLWPGAPGCSLTTTAQVIDRDPDLVGRMVAAFAEAARFVAADPEAASASAARYIGIHPRFIRAALDACAPDTAALRNHEAMAAIVDLMMRMGYIAAAPAVQSYVDLRFLDGIEVKSAGA